MSVHKVDFGMQKTPEDVLENLCRFLRNEVEAYGTPRGVLMGLMEPPIPMRHDAV